MIYLAVLAFGVTLGLPIAVIFASTAVALHFPLYSNKILSHICAY